MALGSAYGDGFAAFSNTSPNEDGRFVLYIVGDEDTDGSIRLAFTVGEERCNMEARTSGVWNDGGLRISSRSLAVGRDMILSAVAGHLETTNPSAVVGHTKGLIPHIEFDDSGTSQLETPIVGVEQIFTVFGTAVSETTASTIGINIGTTPGRIIENSIHEVGATVPTTEVTVSFFTGTDNTGFLFNRKILPVSAFTANSTLTIPYDNDLGFEANVAVFMEFKGETAFSFKTDVSGNPLLKHEAHELNELGTYTENVIFDVNLDHVLDNSLDPVYARQFA